MSIRFDETDCRIVQALFENSRITNADLAKQIHMSESQCSRRLHRIEQAGVIAGYTALVELGEKVGLSAAPCDRFLSDIVLTAASVIAVQSAPVLKMFHSRR